MRSGMAIQKHGLMRSFDGYMFLHGYLGHCTVPLTFFSKMEYSSLPPDSKREVDGLPLTQ